MSKSPNILLPALGVTGIVLGGAYGIMTRSYKADEADIARAQAQAAEARLVSQEEANTDLKSQIALVQDSAKAKIAELEARPAVATSMSAPAPVRDGAMGLGREALLEEIAAWDVDVLPDGRGLPEGTGNAFDGEELFADKCAACHGDFAEGVDNWPVLAGGFDTLADEDPVKTVGSYWPHLSTVYDYVYRSMPFGEAGTLTPDETYAIVAYILYSNDLIDDEFELSHENLGAFEMPNKDGFVVDDRPEAEYAAWSVEPCMSNCKEEVTVTMRSVFLVNTPPEGGSESVMNPASVEGLPSFSSAGASFIPEAQAKPEAVVEVAAAAVEEPADEGAELIKAGEKVFKKCKACHEVGNGAKNKSGPQLNALIGRTMGSVEGFKYSNVFQAAADEGRIWDEASLTEFLAKPKSYMKGTKMSFSGLKKEGDQVAIIAYLNSFLGE
jgi:cytochrome c2